MLHHWVQAPQVARLKAQRTLRPSQLRRLHAVSAPAAERQMLADAALVLAVQPRFHAAGVDWALADFALWAAMHRRFAAAVTALACLFELGLCVDWRET